MSNMFEPFKNNLCSKYAEKMISIKLTSACNAKCSFCVDKGGYDAARIDVAAIADAANKLTEYNTVIITGGEPLIHFEELVELLNKIRPVKTKIILNTNGWLLTSLKVLKLNGLIDELQISIHHPNNQLNAMIFGFDKIDYQFFDTLKCILKPAKFNISINTTLNKTLSLLPDNNPEKRITELEELAYHIGANKLRLTELKKVDHDQFVDAKIFFPNESFVKKSSKDLITKGCTYYYTTENGVEVSVKRLCKYAKGKDAKAFSCCFIDTNGQKKINVDTKDTFKVVYSDGSVYDDWIFDKDKI